MNFTFGIVTTADKEACNRLQLIIESINYLNIPNFEIIIIGDEKNLSKFKSDHVNIVYFDDSIKPGWITRKKNLITQYAKYDNIVYLHDYMSFDLNWYKGWLEFGGDYTCCMNKIVNLDGCRYRDWTLWCDDKIIQACKKANINDRQWMLPYSELSLSKYMYFSGAYWVAKKSIMQEIKLNEMLVWGQGEDVEWCKIYRRKYDFQMNDKSTVHIIKPDKHASFTELTAHDVARLKKVL